MPNDQKISELNQLVTPDPNDLLAIVDRLANETKFITVTDLSTSGILAPADPQYVTLAVHAALPNERVLTGTANQITVTDGGAGTTVTLSLTDPLTLSQLIIDATSTEALLVRKDSDGGDIFTVDTSTPLITSNSAILIDGAAAATVHLRVQADASQSANIATIEKSDGTVWAGWDERGIYFGNAGTDSTNLFMGDNAGNLTMTGTENVCIGSASGAAITTGSKNLLYGYAAGGQATTSEQNICIGRQSGWGLTTDANGSENSLVGQNTGYAGYLERCVALGIDALGNTSNTAKITGAIAVGRAALYDNRGGGNYNVGVGFNAGFYNRTGDNNIYIGMQAGFGVSNNSHSNNVFIGYKAGTAITTGGSNICIGYQAGDVLTTGASNIIIGYNVDPSANNASNELNIGNSFYLFNAKLGTRYFHNYGTDNLFIGDSAGNFTLTGTKNVGIASGSLDVLMDGYENTAIGYNALGAVNSGYRNTAIGVSAGESITDGHSNTLIGRLAGATLTSGTQSTCVGNLAGWKLTIGTGNVFFGNSAGEQVTDGDDNTIIGSNAGDTITQGNRNTLVGRRAGATILTSDDNTLIGAYAGVVSTGSRNTFIGRNAGYSNTSGYVNVVIGKDACYSNRTGAFNVIIGQEAGLGVATNSHSNNVFIGYQSGLAITTGSNNVLLGYKSGDVLTTGGSNIIIGYDIDPSGAAVSNELNIGDLITGYLAAHGSGPAVTVVGALTVDGQADVEQLVVQAVAGQTANIAVFETSGGTDLVAIDDLGVLVSRVTHRDLAGSLRALDFLLTANPTGNTAAVYSGVAGQTYIVGNDNFTNPITAFKGTVQSSNTGILSTVRVNSFDIVINAAGTIVDGIDLYIETPQISGGGAITNSYGIYIKNHNVASVLNYAIYTNAGSISFGDDLEFRQAAVISTTAGNLQLNPSADIDIAKVTDYTWAMGDSAKDPTIDAPADWVQVEIAGTVRYLPAYAA